MFGSLIIKIVSLLFHLSAGKGDVYYVDIVQEGQLIAKYSCAYDDDGIITLEDEFVDSQAPVMEIEASDLYAHVYTVHIENENSHTADLGELLMQIPSDAPPSDMSFSIDESSFDLFYTHNGLIAAIEELNVVIFFRW